MKICRGFRTAVTLRLVEHQGEGIATVISEALAVMFVGVFGMSATIEILCPDVEGLMNVSHVMGEQRQGNRLGNSTRILFALQALQDADAEGDHVNDVKL